MVPRALAPGLGSLLLALATGCRSQSGQSYFDRHLDGEIWAGAFREQLEHPSQALPAAEFLVATPLVMILDDDLTEDSVQQIFTGGNTVSGDYLAVGLGVTSIGYGVVDSLDGDGKWSDSLEIALESMIATAATTQVLKVAVGRERPNGSANDSFPSGHTSFAFSAATFLARAIDDETEGPNGELGYLFYIPAVYVGIDRVEGQKHWTSDVTFGAFLGIFLTNWIYDAHRDDGIGERPLISPARDSAAWRVAPVFEGSQIGLSVNVSI